MEEVKTNSGQTMGIAALITAIITFVFAVIPCIGIIAIIPGIIAIVLASVGLSQASRNNSPKGVLIAGLVIGIVAVLISFSQIFVIGGLAKHKDKWPTDIQSIINDVHESVRKDLKDANVSIKIESGKDKVEINANSEANKKVLEQKLEDLESGNRPKNDTVKKAK
jgi:phosphate/sulfate permease